MITLGVTLILLVVATQIAKLTSDSAMQTMVEKERLVAQEIAMSGIHLAMLILSKDAAENQIDSVQEEWADSEKIQQAVDMLGIEKARVELKIVDETGKIQLNALLRQYPGHEINQDQYTVLERFLTLAVKAKELEDPVRPIEILNALKDWLDSDDGEAVTGLSGAESDYYQELDPPYTCANSPLTHVDELLSVKSVVKELFSFNFLEESDDQDSDSSSVELKDMFSVYGISDIKTEQRRYTFPGLININTAPEQVIAALLPEGREHLAQDLVIFRLDKPDQENNYTNILEKGWYSKVIELSDKEKTAFDRKITYFSNFFRADCKVKTDHYKIGLSAVIKREKNKESGQWFCRILQLEGV